MTEALDVLLRGAATVDDSAVGGLFELCLADRLDLFNDTSPCKREDLPSLSSRFSKVVFKKFVLWFILSIFSVLM